MKEHLGKGLEIKTASVLQLYNLKMHTQETPGSEVLVFDLRSRKNYHNCHLLNSINFPLDCCHHAFFETWDKQKELSDKNSEIIKNKKKRELFNRRKRHYIFIIAGQGDMKNLFEDMRTHLHKEELTDLAESLNADGES